MEGGAAPHTVLPYIGYIPLGLGLLPPPCCDTSGDPLHLPHERLLPHEEAPKLELGPRHISGCISAVF